MCVPWSEVAYYAPAVLTNLVNDLLYHCYVESFNCNGVSPPSDVVYATPSNTPTLPIPTEILVVSPYIITPGSIKISWSQPFDDGRSPLQGYVVTCTPASPDLPAGLCAQLRQSDGVGVEAAQLGEAGAELQQALQHESVPSASEPPLPAAPAVSASVQSGTFSAVLSGMRVGAEYYCNVMATNTVGQGPPGETVLVVPRAAPTIPSPPEFAFVSPGDRRLTFMWEAPVDIGDFALSSYRISCTAGAASPVFGAHMCGAGGSCNSWVLVLLAGVRVS